MPKKNAESKQMYRSSVTNQIYTEHIGMNDISGLAALDLPLIAGVKAAAFFF